MIFAFPPDDAQHHQRSDPQPGGGRPALHRLLRPVHRHRLRPQLLAVRAGLVPGRAVSHLRDVIHQHLHPHPHVHRQVPGGRVPGK